MGQVKAGVIGVGKMGEYHVGVLSEMSEVSLVGVADIDEGRARTVAKNHGHVPRGIALFQNGTLQLRPNHRLYPHRLLRNRGGRQRKPHRLRTNDR